MIATPVNEAVDVKFVPVKVAPDTVFSTQIATVTFTRKLCLYFKQNWFEAIQKRKLSYQWKIAFGLVFVDTNKIM